MDDVLQNFAFSMALEWLKDKRKVARRGWNGSRMWLRLQYPDENSMMTVPYVYMKTANEDLVPWVASQTDILSEDWYLVRE